MLFIFFLGVEAGYVTQRQTQRLPVGCSSRIHRKLTPFALCLLLPSSASLIVSLSVDAVASQQVSVGMIYCHQ